ncbi:MAG TPA: hypothetical protein VEA18_03840 [Candidatus Kapabacteria bacterium]|nr:hypothetical protein [Candidatus Kapabacteria bacterium]
MQGSFGAISPPGAEWQAGKTAASIKFVKDAEKWLENIIESSQKGCVEDYVRLIKAGEVVLNEFLDIQDFLRQCW